MITFDYLWKEWILPFIHAAFWAALIIIFVVQSFRVDGISMENTLYDGERIFVEKVSYRFREPRRGEIIVLKAPAGKLIKRVIAVGGDVIQERSGVIYINGVPQEEEYVTHKTNMNWGPIIVPEGHVWVMGDNRPRSDDSRGSVGFLSTADIVGRAIVRYWHLNRVGSIY